MFTSSTILSVFLLNVNLFDEHFVSGCDEFCELTKQLYFVDKSLLLEKYFSKENNLLGVEKNRKDGQNVNYHYVSVPRGFGKTTNLQMIRSFAQFEVKQNFSTMRFDETKAYRDVFGKLKIINRTKVVRKHMNQYGVIYLDLTFEVDELTNNTVAEKSFVKKLGRSFESYEWFWNISSLSRALATVRTIALGNMSSQSIFRGLYCMGQVLDKFEPKGIILLVDNFDSAARASVQRPGLAIKFLYDLVYKSIDKLLSVNLPTTGGEFHRRTVCLVTGITSLYFESMNFQSYKSFEYTSFLTTGYLSHFFGFDQDDVDILFEKYNCSRQERTAVINYYKGYTAEDNMLLLYNPISITNYLNSKKNSGMGKLEPYWARNEPIDFIVEFSKAPLFRAKLKDLCTQNTFKVSSPFKLIDPTMFISFLESSCRSYEDMLDEDVPSLLYYFYQHGFLKHASKFDCVFAFGNFEVKTEIKRRLQQRGVKF